MEVSNSKPCCQECCQFKIGDPVGPAYCESYLQAKKAAAQLPKQKLGLGADNRGNGRGFLDVAYQVLENHSVYQKEKAFIAQRVFAELEKCRHCLGR